MIILAIRTDRPESEAGIFDGSRELLHYKWLAHRELGVTIHKKIHDLLKEAELSLKSIEGLVVYEGPGSFTGLRIGMSVANALAYSLKLPIVAAGGKDWLEEGARLLENGQDHVWAVPVYGGEVNITKPAK